MQRKILFFGFAALLFVAGVLAGQSVNSTRSPATAPLEDHTSSEVSTPEDLLDDKNADSVTSISFQRHVEFDDTVDRDNAASAENQSQKAELTLASGVDSAHRQAVRRMIDRIFPNTEDSVAEGWADACVDMELSEVEFLLEQKRLLSGTLGIQGSLSFESSVAGSPGIADPNTESPSKILNALSAVRNNLQSAWSPGFRRTVVLPDAAPPGSTPPAIPLQRRVRMFVSFDPGRVIASPISTHVALPSSDGMLMFCLDGEKLTRRGDFELLSDGRLGLVSHDGSYAVKGCAALPEDSSDVQIAANGEILCTENSGEVVVVGCLSVARVTNAANLKTSDGVLFWSEKADQIQILAPTELKLMVNSLEISNVALNDEESLLRQLSLMNPNSMN